MGLGLAEQEELDQWKERGGHAEAASEGAVQNGPHGQGTDEKLVTRIQAPCGGTREKAEGMSWPQM